MQYSQPLVSVVIPCYNHESFVQASIQSVIDQTYENIELIIIDDGSKDSSVTKIQEMIDPCKNRFVRFEFRKRSNKGLSSTLNEALEWCQGDFFSPTASDDILFNEKIRMQSEILSQYKDKNVVGVFSGISCIDENHKMIKQRGRDSNFGFKDVFLRKAFMPGQASMLLRKELVNIGGYNSNFDVEDFYVFLKLANSGFRFISIKEPLVYYRRHDDNLSSKSDVMWNSISGILSEYSDHKEYKQAISCSMLIQAHDLQVVSNKKALQWSIKAVKKYPLNVVSPSLLWLSFKFFKKIISM